MQSVVERVLNLLIFLLESPTPVTAEDIRRTVMGYGDQTDEAFHRMFERDKEVLRRLGVPLELRALDAWEVDYGYVVDPGKYALEDPGLTPEERAALSVAARIVRLGGRSAGFDALLKLGGVERGLGLEPIGADLGAESAILGEIFGAIRERRIVELTYKGRHRRVEPYGLGHSRGHWYLVGASDGEPRVFRVDRVEALRVGEEPERFRRPRGFKVRDAIRSHPWEAGGDETIEATVRFDESVAWWAARTLGAPTPTGDLVTTMRVSNRDAFLGWLLSFSPAVEIIAPAELRAELARRVEAVLSALERR